MQSDYLYMKSLAFQRYLKMVNEIFHYLAHYSTKPMHKLFKMEKKEFKEFKSRVMSMNSSLEDWKKLVSVFNAFQNERFLNIYLDFFEYGMPYPYKIGE